MPKALASLVVAVTISIPLAACGGEQSPMKTGIAPPTRIPAAAAPAGPAGEVIPTADVPREVRRAVVADAAKRFKVAESAVVVTQAEKVTWSDAALGCPEPSRMYAQMLVDGYRLVAKTTAGSFTYHTDGGGNVVSCAGAARQGTRASELPVMDNEPKPYPATPAAPEK